MSRPSSSDEARAKRFGFRALLAYGAVWAALSAGVAFAVVAAVDGEESVTLPPVQAIELTAAARAAGCAYSAGDRLDAHVPVSGAWGRPAAPGVYESPPGREALVGALHDGIIVVHYRPDLPEPDVKALQVIQRAVPAGTIVTPNAEMESAVVVTAWRRLLSCSQFTDRTIDALRLFRGRHVGKGASSD